MNPHCKIGKVTPRPQYKQIGVLHEKIISYKSPEDVVEFTRHFFDVLRDESVRSVGVIYETTEGTGTNYIVTPGGTFSTLIGQCDVLKHRLIEGFLCG